MLAAPTSHIGSFRYQWHKYQHLWEWYDVNVDFVVVDSGLNHLWQMGTDEPGLTLQNRLSYPRQGQSFSAMRPMASTNT